MYAQINWLIIATVDIDPEMDMIAYFIANKCIVETIIITKLVQQKYKNL